MCYHYSRFGKSADTQREYGLSVAPDPVWDAPAFHVNGFSFPTCPIILSNSPNILSTARWGLIPFFIKTENEAIKIRSMTLNARGETLFEKPSFRHAALKKRCLIPASGFFEWHTKGKFKIPYFITDVDECGFSIAGIYDDWVNPETGEMLGTFSMVTTEANSLMAKIHHDKMRMPCIISPSNREIWLDENSTKQALSKCMVPYPTEKIKAWTISKLINSRHENSNVPEVILPFLYTEFNDLP